MAPIAAMPDANANAAVPPSIAARLASSGAPRRILRARVFVALVLAERVLHVRRRLEDRRDDRARGRIGLLAGVDADGGKSRVLQAVSWRRHFHR